MVGLVPLDTRGELESVQGDAVHTCAHVSALARSPAPICEAVRLTQAGSVPSEPSTVLAPPMARSSQAGVALPMMMSPRVTALAVVSVCAVASRSAFVPPESAVHVTAPVVTLMLSACCPAEQSN